MVLLAALEDLIKEPEARVYWKVLDWWLLVQDWCTLRFDDHRGILPSDSGRGQRWNASESLSSTQELSSNTEICCLRGGRYYARLLHMTGDHLIPAPTNSYKGGKYAEL